jgi:SAM-dependent methyltransferase
MKPLVDYKSDSYHKQRHPEFLNSEKLSIAWSEFAFLEYFKGKPFSDILEFGGGLGQNLIYVAKNSNVWMIEPSDIGRAYAKKFNIKPASSMEELKTLNEGKYDMIMCRHVLEHLDNPLKTLIELKSLLKPNGELILVLPIEKKTKPIKNDIDFHLFCWTPRTAYNLLKTANFVDITWNYNYFTGKQLFLPIYKCLGVKYYRLLMKFAGLVFNAKELLIRAK